MELNFKKLGSGQPMVILHGLLGTLDNWITLGRQFSENFTVYLVDLRNHGLSPHSEEFTYDAMMEDVLELFEAEGIEKPILLGHSMGGKVAMNLALNSPESIEKLIVADIDAKAYHVQHEQILNGLNALPIDKISSRKEADDELAKYVDEFEIRQFLLKNLDRTSAGFSWKMNLPVITRDIEKVGVEIGKGQSVDLPTLFIRGANSNYIKDENWNALKEKFPKAELKTIENAGHWLHAEQPEEFYKIVMDFVK